MRHERGTHSGLDVVVLSRSCLMSPVCTAVWNKSKLAITEADRFFFTLCQKWNAEVSKHI